MTQCPGSRHGERGTTVVISGEIDIANWDNIVELVRNALSSETTEIALDMSTVEFIDCAGLAGILQAWHLAAEEGCHLRVASMTPRARRLLDLTETFTLLTGPPQTVAGTDSDELRLERPGVG